MEDEKKKKTGRDIEFIPQDEPSAIPPATQEPLNKETLDQYIVLLRKLQSPNRHIDTAPTDTPQNFLDSFRFFDDGTNRRLYVFINGTWRYSTLS